MGLLADLYLAHEADAKKYPRQQSAFPDRVQMKSFTSLEFSTLWAFMQGVEWDDDVMDDFKTVIETDSQWIFKFPTEMVTALATMTPIQKATVLPLWAETEELDCSPEDLRPVVEAMVPLARQATETGKNLYLWNCL